MAPGAADPAKPTDMMEADASDAGTSEPHSGEESVELMEPGDPVSEEEPGQDSDYEEELPPRLATRRSKRRRAEDSQIADE